MKVTKELTKDTFKPFNITITIESEEDYQTLRNLTEYEFTTPKHLKDSGLITSQEAKNLTKLMQYIYSSF